MRKYAAFVLFLSSWCLPCAADVRLPKILASNMVLQRESHVSIWGWADPKEAVEVSCDWADADQKTIADEQGRWKVLLDTGPAGGPHRLTIRGKNTIVLDGVLLGEVWLASGQSNMEIPLAPASRAYTGIQDYEKEIAEADEPDIRLFQVGNFSSKEPLEDVQPGCSMYGIPPAACQWEPCSPQSVPMFSSTAYFFARKLHSQLKVPVGLIDSSWGGTSAEAWTPKAGLAREGLDADLEKAAKLPQQPDQKIPTRLYNGMIHPLRHFTIRGVIWYQGESNSKRASQYRSLFTTMIRQWRSAFGYEFPFYFVQLAPYNYTSVNAAFLREAQLQTLSLARTGMAVTMDIGNLSDIHPKNKQEVGRRLALWALAKDYGQEVAYSGPLYRDCQIQDAKITVNFDCAGSGLATNDGQPPSHLEIAGADRVFHPASAEIQGDKLVVWSDEVPKPEAVRYAFTSDAMPNLINGEGLPASSFRTDNW